MNPPIEIDLNATLTTTFLQSSTCSARGLKNGSRNSLLAPRPWQSWEWGSRWTKTSLSS